MNRVAKWVGVCAAVLPLVAMPTAGAATVLHLSPLEGMEGYLQGYLCQNPDNTCERIESPNSSPFVSVPGFPDTYPDGVVAIEDAIDQASADAPDGEIVVFAYSSGARMAAQWLEAHAGDEDAPSSDKLSLVLVGNPTRAYGGSDVVGRSGPAMPQTQYQVTDVSIQYDLTSDSPNNPASFFYLLALINAYAGFSLHLNYAAVDINDPANAVWTEGNTTYILVPTENLPMLDQLRGLGLTALADALNGPLKALVEQAYNRPVPLPTPSQPAPPAITTAAASAPSASVVADPTVASRNATVTLSLAPTPAAHSAPTSTEPAEANANGKDLAVADTPATTPPPHPADVLDTVKTITPPAAPPGPNDAIAAKQSTTARTTHTTTASTTDGNKVGPGKVGETQSTTNSENQAASTRDSENAAHSDE
jgi:hypothetical protein